MKTVVFCLLIVGALAAPSRKPIFRRGLNRIVGGLEATPGQFPYQLSLQDISFGFAFHICGASIYTDTRAICAAHCINEDVVNFDMLQIMAGEHNFDDVDGYEQTSAISKIILHEGFDNWKSNDISIIYLSQTLKFNERVQPVPLQSKKEYEGRCVVSGWGATAEGGSSPSNLQYVELPTIPDSECDRYHAPSGIEDSMICAGYPEGGKDFCDGDDGGPLVCDGLLTGIVSWSYGCARHEYPGVYAEVAYFKTWIEQNI